MLRYASGGDGLVFSAVEGFGDHLRIPFWKPPDELTARLTRLVAIWRATHSRSAFTPAARPSPSG
ncbi:hypothetical protein [Spongiactinospora gelatinilytica]|uniref:hypothetical protein n=1 Tax=Spongiactinospora gelatinilytica TaxID=2666298 RepID=UPI0018F37B48|nr:hypothetical protein [Spongiactinospora gelatinilytica]